MVSFIIGSTPENVQFSMHAIDELTKDGLTTVDAWNVLKGTSKIHYEGELVNGRGIEVLMYCSNCDNRKSLKAVQTTRKFDESGLNNITLKGIIEYKCPNCGEVYIGYGHLEQLHQLIAQHLVRKKAPLIYKEIRFLRKYMGYSSAMLAKLVGQKPEHISRLENGKTKKITPLFDHFIRALVIEKLPDRNYDLHDHILNESGEEFTRLEARYKNEQWDVRAV